jgi:hypothetical protein
MKVDFLVNFQLPHFEILEIVSCYTHSVSRTRAVQLDKNNAEGGTREYFSRFVYKIPKGEVDSFEKFLQGQVNSTGFPKQGDALQKTRCCSWSLKFSNFQLFVQKSTVFEDSH